MVDNKYSYDKFIRDSEIYAFCWAYAGNFGYRRIARWWYKLTHKEPKLKDYMVDRINK